MSLVMVDNPDCVIDWFASYPEAERARKVAGDCPHECPHNVTSTVGWGPDLEHYELVVCDVTGGCDGNCRGWMAGTGATSYELHRRIGWKLLGDAEASP